MSSGLGPVGEGSRAQSKLKFPIEKDNICELAKSAHGSGPQSSYIIIKLPSIPPCPAPYQPVPPRITPHRTAPYRTAQYHT